MSEKYVDPAMEPILVPVDEIVPQMVNPNYQSDKAFKALQTSILSNGMAYGVLVSKNPLYDPNTKNISQTARELESGSITKDGITYTKKDDGVELRWEDGSSVMLDKNLYKPRCFTGGQDIVDVRDPRLRSFYEWQVVDGCHRLLAVLYGSPSYAHLNNEDSKKIYERCNGMIPCSVLKDKTDQELMSATILFNSARGDHDLMEMKDIVADLSRSGMTDQWIAKFLFLDKETITRFKQLSGMRSAFNNCSELEDAWDPYKDMAEERRTKHDLSVLALKYVNKYRELKGLKTGVMSDQTDIFVAASDLGWNESSPTEMPKTLDEADNVIEKEILGDEK